VINKYDDDDDELVIDVESEDRDCDEVMCAR